MLAGDQCQLPQRHQLEHRQPFQSRHTSGHPRQAASEKFSLGGHTSSIEALGTPADGLGEGARRRSRRQAGVSSDEGEGDDWPGLRRRILDADILVLGTPIWLGHQSSICQRVLERLDAFLGEEDERGRMISYDRVAAVAVVGNEDGAHHIFAELTQGLSDEGFTIPPEGSVHWVGEAMSGVDYKDRSPTPEAMATATKTLARNAAHLGQGAQSRALSGSRVGPTLRQAAALVCRGPEVSGSQPSGDEQHEQHERDQSDDPTHERDFHEKEHDRDDDEQSDESS